MQAIAFAITGIEGLMQLLTAGINISADLARLKGQLQIFKDENRDPSDAEWIELNTRIRQSLDELNKPI